MPSLDDEALINRLLAKCGLRAERFTKAERRKGQTPDFRVFKGAELQFYCEVKSVEEDTWLEAKLGAVPKGTFVGGARNDPVFNRLTDDIHKAAKQFGAVNPTSAVPNVLMFVNHDSMCDRQDLMGVLTGDFLANDGTSHRIYRKFSEGRVKKDKATIHLFCWIEDGRPRGYVFNEEQKAHCRLLCKLLSLDSRKIRSHGP